MRLQRSFIVAVLTLFCWISIQTAKAGTEKYISYLNGSSIAANSLISISDPLATTGTKINFFVNSVLRFDDWRRDYYFNNFDITVIYELTLRRKDNSAVVIIDTLTINYDTVNAYKDMQINRYGGFVSGVMEITSVSYNGITSIPEDVFLELEVEFERYYANTVVPTVSKLSTGLNKNELPLGWNYVAGAESYDLEWIFIDTTSRDHAVPYYNFKNATRVNIPDNHYNISMAFPSGILVYRVRPAGIIVDNSGIKKSTWGTWSITTEKGYVNGSFPANNYFVYKGLEKQLNWQYNEVFAEDGKRKEAITFYDGSLRNRQQVTVVNTDSTAIIGESVYDHMGRPAITILPAPVESEGIRFYSNGVTSTMFNGDFDKTYFDTDSLIVNPRPLNYNSNVSLSDKYYSPENGFMDSINYSRYTPDATHYPYIQTRYLNDGTDRICRQSGAGIDFKLGSNHETKYYYGTPSSQQELDRLFGNEVGYMQYYQKNLVVDANGQVSVSYLDRKDRVIATALSGIASPYLPLDHQSAFDTIYGSYNTAAPATADNEKVVLSTLLIDAPGKTYMFDYNLGETQFCDTCFTCKDCYYHLVIRVRDMETGLNIFEADTITQNIRYQFTLTFSNIGSYQIYKNLSVYQDSVDSYINQYRVGQTCMGLPDVDTAACVFTCEDYCTSVFRFTSGSSTFYLDQNRDTITQSEAQIKIDSCILMQCSDETALPSECEMKLGIMLHDMSLGGQYFENLPQLSFYDPITGEDSINVNYANQKNDWLIAMTHHENLDTSDIHYMFDGDTVPVAILQDLAAGDTSELWDWVRDNWQSNWDTTMLKFHPEYCIYQFYCLCAPTTTDPKKYPTPYDYHIYDSIAFGMQQCNDSIFEVFMNPLALPSNTATSWVANSSWNYYMPYALTDSTQADPFFWRYGRFQCVAEFCDSIAADTGMVQVIEDSLFHFVKWPGADSACSIWYLLDDPDHFADSAGSPYIPAELVHLFSYIQDTLLVKTDSIYDCEGMGKFMFFRSSYQFFKNGIMQAMLENCPISTTDPCGYLDAFTTQNGAVVDIDGFKIRWLRNPIYDFYNADDFADSVEMVILDSCPDICEYKAAGWMVLLNDYITEYGLQAYETTIFNGLVGICSDNCSGQNPGGLIDSADYVTLMLGICDTCDFPMIWYPERPYSSSDCSCGNYSEFLDQYNLTFDSDSIVIHDTIYNNLGYLFSSDTISLWNHSCKAHDSLYVLESIGFPDFFLCPSSGFNPYVSLQSYLDSLRTDCERLAGQAAYNQAVNLLQNQLADSLISYRNILNQHCIEQSLETFNVKFFAGEFQYTLYYYDQADNLIKTVPPEGVFPITDTTILDSVAFYRVHGGGYIHPEHGLITNYHFNSLEKTHEQNTPDAGTGGTYYDILGRIVVSQNSQQFADESFSYTIYDALGRISEVGSIGDLPYAMVQDSAIDTSALHQWLDAGTKTQITQTFYDSKVKTIPGFTQANLRNRVASITYCNFDYGVDSLFDAATHYCYDIHGNVSSIIQDVPMLAPVNRRFIRADYDFDLVSGKVNALKYMDRMVDAFHHRYTYDADNRITNVFTSHNQVQWDHDAKYFYYPHAPLARTEIGDRQVQGMDYYYTLQGWIKGVNSSTLYAYRDPGNDAVNDTNSGFYLNANFGQDAASYNLGYFAGDYNPVHEFNTDSLSMATPDPSIYTCLYNGNISSMITNLLAPDTVGKKLPDTLTMMLKSYRYDCLNRLKTANTFIDESVADSNDWGQTEQTDSYSEAYKYDNNGNITNLLRYASAGENGILMDSLTYHYSQTSGKLDNNKLEWIKDKIPETRFSEDLDNQGQNNYLYDQIGNLIHDQANGLDTILWNVYGKVKSVIPLSGLGKQRIDFAYDATGNRLYKRTFNYDSTGAKANYQFYARDAQGNILSVYSLIYSELNERWELRQTENHLYGSSRLGIEKCDTLLSFYTSSANPLNMPDTLQEIQNRNQALLIAGSTEISKYEKVDGSATYISYIDYTQLVSQMTNWAIANRYEHYFENGVLFLSTDSISFLSLEDILAFHLATASRHIYVNRSEVKRNLGNKQFELTNHLGNVISTVSDRKLAVEDIDSLLYVQYYAPQIVSAQDYYSFGMMMPGRSFSIEDTTAQRIDTVPDIPCDDHFEDGIAGWLAMGPTAEIDWDTTNERLHLLAIDQWSDYTRIAVDAIPYKTYTISCNINFTSDYAISMEVTNPMGSLIAYRYVYNGQGMPVTLTFTNVGTDYVYIQFVKAIYEGIPASFYFDDVVMTGDSITDTNSVRVPLASYPFGFNGKEKVNEIYGSANAYDFGARIYDPRVGRFFSIDPLCFNYSGWSGYAGLNDNPNLFNDPTGKGGIVTIDHANKRITISSTIYVYSDGCLSDDMAKNALGINANSNSIEMSSSTTTINLDVTNGAGNTVGEVPYTIVFEVEVIYVSPEKAAEYKEQYADDPSKNFFMIQEELYGSEEAVGHAGMLDNNGENKQGEAGQNVGIISYRGILTEVTPESPLSNIFLREGWHTITGKNYSGMTSPNGTDYSHNPVNEDSFTSVGSFSLSGTCEVTEEDYTTIKKLIKTPSFFKPRASGVKEEKVGKTNAPLYK